VQALVPHFVPVADEVSHLQRGGDPECRLFQKIAEQGHYAGRRVPSGTRQGTYVAAPSGLLLASINSTDPERMAGMLRQGLAGWEALSREERRRVPEELPGAADELSRGERFYPSDGLALRVNSRDLPRELDDSTWTARAWNQDYAWFTREEARRFLPEQPLPGAHHEVPVALIGRIARFQLVDNVRGQVRPFEEADIERAVLAAEVTAAEDGVVSLRFQGETRTSAEGVWSIHGYADRETPTPQRRGLKLRLLGHARYDLGRERFLAFEMVALGTRWGATQYNVRYDDLGPAPIGFVLTLAGDTPAERVAPAFLRATGLIPSS
jgi:hypothetical protein